MISFVAFRIHSEVNVSLVYIHDNFNVFSFAQVWNFSLFYLNKYVGSKLAVLFRHEEA